MGDRDKKQPGASRHPRVSPASNGSDTERSVRNADAGDGRDNARKEKEREDELWLPISTPSPSASLITTPQQQQAKTPDTVGWIDLPAPAQRARYKAERLLAWPLDRLKATLGHEFEKGAAFLWSPVFLGLGCLCYFTLPREPAALAFPLLCALMLVLAWRIGRGHKIYLAFMALALIAAGASAGQFRTLRLDTPMISKTLTGHVTGRVIRAEFRANGSTRYTLDLGDPDSRFEFTGATTRPNKIRLTARAGGTRAAVGTLLGGTARLGPPPGPAFPGGYDFSFQSWFEGSGGSGFFLGKPEIVTATKTVPPSWSLKLAQVRAKISALIRQALPGTNGGLAAALIVGDRSGIDKQVAENLRQSGLAHILAISGLHMALVSATVIFVLRAVFACFPAVSLSFPVRKWACGAALVVATFYLLLSGAGVSTRRAYIMIAIMLLAVLCDRRALTMRNVALAALIILLTTPEAVLSPGFQMSFAAVAALVATYETVTLKRAMRSGTAAATWHYNRIRRFVVRDIGGLALTSLVAGVATSLFAAWHFQRIAPLGLLANVLAMPLVTFAVMPLALLSVLAMPFALEAVPLALMGTAMDLVITIAGRVSQAGPPGYTGFLPPGTVLFGTLALLVATLSRTKLKWLAVPLLMIAVSFLAGRDLSGILILENGKQLGLVEQKRGLGLLRPNAEKFSTAMWRSAFDPNRAGKVKPAARGKPGQGFLCDAFGCSTSFKGITITHIRNTAKLVEDCRLSDVIVVPYPLKNGCSFLPENRRPLIFDRTSLRRQGAIRLTVKSGENAAPANSRFFTPAQNTPKQPPSTEISANPGFEEGSGFEQMNGFLSQKHRIKIHRAYGTSPRPWTRHRFNGVD